MAIKFVFNHVGPEVISTGIDLRYVLIEGGTIYIVGKNYYPNYLKREGIEFVDCKEGLAQLYANFSLENHRPGFRVKLRKALESLTRPQYVSILDQEPPVAIIIEDNKAFEVKKLPNGYVIRCGQAEIRAILREINGYYTYCMNHTDFIAQALFDKPDEWHRFC